MAEEPAVGGNMRRWAGVLVVWILCAAGPAARAQHDHWVGTWASSPLVPSTIIENEQLTIGSEGTTLREVVRVTLGGDTFRVRFTNVFGTRPLTIGAAEIAPTLSGSAIKPGSGRILHFHGQASVTIQPGALAVSDPVAIEAGPLSNLTVSLYLPALPGTLTEHQLANATSYQVAGNKVSEPELSAPTRETAGSI